MRKGQPSCGRKGILHLFGLGRRGKCGKCGEVKPHKGRSFSFEPLEDRKLLSVCVWDGGGSNNLWSNPANWASGVAPGANDDLVFRGTELTQTENDLAAGTAFRSLRFRSSDFSITGNDLAVTRRISVGPGASGATIDTGVALSGTVQVTVTGGPLSLSGVVSGSGSLFENGNGVLVLGASDTYTGSTRIQAGATLQLGYTNALPSGIGTGSVKVNGTLDLAGYSTTLNGLSGGGIVCGARRDSPLGIEIKE